MTPFRVLALILGVVLLVTAATPARAEAMEMTTILLIATVAGAIVLVIAYLIVANMSDRRHAAVPADGTPLGGTPLAGTPVGGTAVGGTPVAETAVAVASYVVAPAPPAPTVQGQ